jgi:hypothetical protein
MSLFTNIDILDNLLYYFDVNDVIILLKTSKSIKTAIIKYYQIHGVNFTNMPIFIPCNDILLYLQHYHSYINGNNFPEEPLWLFRNKEDGKFIKKDNRYIKLNNIRFERPKFFTYITDYQSIEFINALDCWKQLNQQQRYLIWCQNRSLFQLQMTLSF